MVFGGSINYVKKMAEFLFFGSQIMGGWGVGVDFDGDAFDYGQACFFEGFEFVGVVGDHLHLAEPEVEEDLCALLVGAGVDSEA